MSTDLSRASAARRGRDDEGSPTDRPVLFVSYSTEDDFQVSRLALDLGDRGKVPVFTLPFDLDRRGKGLIENVKRHVDQSRILILALTAATLADDWFETTLARQVLPNLRGDLDEIYVLRLGQLIQQDVPPTLAGYPTEDLSGENYPSGLANFLADLGLAEAGEAVPLPTKYHHVEGIFEIGRRQSDMFAELKKQVADGGRIDQKYLYWDVRAALRWQKIARSSTYLTSQTSTNMWRRYAGPIIKSVVDDCQASHFSFINFGVGTGEKDNLILQSLLEQTSGRLLYFPIDESLSMLQITIQELQDVMLHAGDRLRLHYILDDFNNVHRFRDYVRGIERQNFRRQRVTRILGFLGGSIGNFYEAEILRTLQAMMTPNDYLILGVEMVAGRDDDTLIANYSDKRMKEFLYGPISDLEGIPPNWEQLFSYEVKHGDPRYTHVDNARTVVGWVTHREPIEMFYSTKYEAAPLEEFLKSLDFDVVQKFVSDDQPPRYTKYVLKLGRKGRE